MPSRWQPPPFAPLSLVEQLRNCGGCEEPTLERSRDGQAWRFTAARVLAHQCRESKGCEFCAAAKRSGYVTVRVTRDTIRNGEALNVIGRALWAGAKQGRLL